MKLFARVILCFLIGFPPLIIQANTQDVAYIQMAYQAYQRRQSDELATLANTMDRSVMGAYPRFWQIKLKMTQNGGYDPSILSDIQTFRSRYPNTYLSNRLMSDWLKQRGQADDLTTVRQYIQQVEDPDTELSCYGWRADIRVGGNAFIEPASRLWERSLRTPAVCQSVFAELVRRQAISPLQAMERVHLLWRLKQETAAKNLALSLPEPYALSPVQYDAAVKNSNSVLTSGNGTRSSKLIALLRLAYGNPTLAASSVHSATLSTLTPDEQALFWNMVGFEGSKVLLPSAASWFMKVPTNATYRPRINEVAAWKARAGLRGRQWQVVLKATEQMNPSMANLPDWIYWRAKALYELGRTADAQSLWASIADKPVYYGILASEEIERPYRLPTPYHPTQVDQQLVLSTGELQRAITLFQAGYRTEALGEWAWTVRNMDDARLLAAAQIALQSGLYDRAISAADQTKQIHNFNYRYPLPHRSSVRAVSNNMGVPETYIYGLIRQESRFVSVARSSAGASGLMQLMPATATWTAKRIGMTDYSKSRVNDIDVNLKLGTAYLSYTMGLFDNQMPLAYAAYNAGPGRPKQWRANVTLDGPVYIETIPFDETRDYVKKVLANVYIYELVMKERSTPIKTLSGSIAGK